MEKGICGRGNGMERPKQEKECGKKKEKECGVFEGWWWSLGSKTEAIESSAVRRLQ